MTHTETTEERRCREEADWIAKGCPFVHEEFPEYPEDVKLEPLPPMTEAMLAEWRRIHLEAFEASYGAEAVERYGLRKPHGREG